MNSTEFEAKFHADAHIKKYCKHEAQFSNSQHDVRKVAFAGVNLQFRCRLRVAKQ